MDGFIFLFSGEAGVMYCRRLLWPL